MQILTKEEGEIREKILVYEDKILRLALGTATPSAAGSTASLGRYPKTAAAAALGRRSRQNSVSSGSGGHGTLGDPCRAPGCTRLLRQSQMKTIFLGVL
jgi:hypothetical protein